MLACTLQKIVDRNHPISKILAATGLKFSFGAVMHFDTTAVCTSSSVTKVLGVCLSLHSIMNVNYKTGRFDNLNSAVS